MKTGLVLGGGAARGAYEAGVVSYLRGDLARQLGRPVPIEVVAGTSVGALNACFVAATAESPAEQGKRIVEHWQSIRIEEILRFGLTDVFRTLREFLGKEPIRWSSGLTGGLVNPGGLLKIVYNGVPWRRIRRNVEEGHLEALTVSATHVATGRVISFVQNRSGEIPPWGSDPHSAVRLARMGPKHAMASAAIPVLFPSVRVGGQLYVDGGLRNSLPLAPALRLGAERVIVVPLRHDETPEELNERAQREQVLATEHAVATAPFLLGKTFNALMLDHTDQDLDRLKGVNTLIEAGTQAYGPGFAQTLNSALVPLRSQPVRYIRNVVIRPSQDIGKMAAAYVHSAEFKRRVSGLVASVIRRLADRESPEEADLVSYLLFDGGFADQLIQLGHADARAQRAEWERFFTEPAGDEGLAQPA